MLSKAGRATATAAVEPRSQPEVIVFRVVFQQRIQAVRDESPLLLVPDLLRRICEHLLRLVL
jgi:hypothetical protein